jgi:hypothetical protein
MRVTSFKVSTAFLAGKKLKVGNTSTNGNEYFLHGNRIAWKENGLLYVSLAGWNSATTRERLTALPGVCVRTKDGQPFLNGKEWNGYPVVVNDLFGEYSTAPFTV